MLRPESQIPCLSDVHNSDDTMEWVSPQYSKGQVDRAGALLLTLDDPNLFELRPAYSDLEQAYGIINNWRSSHSRPLYTFRLGLRRHAERVDDTALVAQRIKRLSSISLKLRLSRHMKLSQMQDIGGCRAVVSSVSQVYDIVKRYKTSDIRHKLLSEDDYISSPKLSGYRSYHLIYSYYSDKKASHNGLRIEVQIRSQLQHAWATAVETVGTFVRQALKSSLGEKEWLRFFALMGSAIAIREKTPLVPVTPSDNSELKTAIEHYAAQLDVAGRLRAYGDALQAVEAKPEIAGADYYLLELDPSAMQISIKPYAQKDLNQAAKDYLAAEKQIAGTNADAVLVSVDSMAALRRAYPNYFLDTQRFVEAVTQAIS